MQERSAHHYCRYQQARGKPFAGPVTCFYLDAYADNAEASALLREARSLKALWSNAAIEIHPEELIIGRICCKEPVVFHYGSGTMILQENINAYIKQQALAGSALREFMSKVEGVQERRYLPNNPEIFTQAELDSIESTAATSTFFGGHLVMDFERVLKAGLSGLVMEIAHSRRQVLASDDFYEAMDTILEGIRVLIRRIADAASQAPSEESKSLSADLAWIADHPPITFRQALQLVWAIHMVSDYDSFGRFDQYLHPFYIRDIEEGRVSAEEAEALLESFWIKIDEAGAIQNMTIGGIDPNGQPAYNALTELVLQVTREMGFSGPNLCLRVHETMPDFYWDEVHASLQTGQGLPALYNDQVVLSFLTRMGIPLDEARDYALGGCSQVNIPGRSNFVNDIGALNVAKCLELALYNGFDPITGKQVGPKTGRIEDMDSFEALKEAFIEQLRYFCRLEAEINNKDILYRREREGYAVRTLFTADCISRGLGVYHGGARHNHVQLECMGITNAADSLAAVYHAVFLDKKVTMDGLIQALRSNFAGYDILLAYLKGLPKFGNQQEVPDTLREEISRFVFDEMRRQRGVCGGMYIPGEVIFTAHEWCGSAVGATPDGRLARTVLADSAGASQGMDRKGPTALMHSVLRIPTDGPLTSIVLNMKFMKALWKENALKIIPLLKGFLRGGGMQLQINVLDREMLQKAMMHPEEYAGLVVRVGGYSAYFTSLSRALQQEILDRTSY